MQLRNCQFYNSEIPYSQVYHIGSLIQKHRFVMCKYERKSIDLWCVNMKENPISYAKI